MFSTMNCEPVSNPCCPKARKPSCLELESQCFAIPTSSPFPCSRRSPHPAGAGPGHPGSQRAAPGHVGHKSGGAQRNGAGGRGGVSKVRGRVMGGLCPGCAGGGGGVLEVASPSQCLSPVVRLIRQTSLSQAPLLTFPA